MCLNFQNFLVKILKTTRHNSFFEIFLGHQNIFLIQFWTVIWVNFDDFLLFTSLALKMGQLYEFTNHMYLYWCRHTLAILREAYYYWFVFHTHLRCSIKEILDDLNAANCNNFFWICWISCWWCIDWEMLCKENYDNPFWRLRRLRHKENVGKLISEWAHPASSPAILLGQSGHPPSLQLTATFTEGQLHDVYIFVCEADL